VASMQWRIIQPFTYQPKHPNRWNWIFAKAKLKKSSAWSRPYVFSSGRSSCRIDGMDLPPSFQRQRFQAMLLLSYIHLVCVIQHNTLFVRVAEALHPDSFVDTEWC